MRIFPLVLLGFVLMLPLVVSAQIVTCLGPECQICHLVSLGQNIINFLISISAIVGAMLFAWAGIKMATAGGNEGQISKARNTFTNVIIGLLIMLGAWLGIDTVMKIAANQDLSQIGGWNKIECVDLPEYRNDPNVALVADFMNPTPGESRGTASGLSGETLSESDINALIASGATYDELVCSAAASAGIGGECASLKALMRIESSGCTNKVSNAGAYGCMQILTSTARQYDSQLANASDVYIQNLLLNDNAYNIKLGVLIYKDAYEKYDGNRDLIYAAYNGGFGANDSSNDCPGKLKWQCEWDDSLHTVPNTGYEETRNYVENINNLREQLQ